MLNILLNDIKCYYMLLNYMLRKLRVMITRYEIACVYDFHVRVSR